MPDDNGHDDNSEHYHDRLIEDRFGNRRYTLNALCERTIAQFLEEIGGRVDLLNELDTPERQRAAITEIADYVIATEYVWLSPDEKTWLVTTAFQELFRLGILESAIVDETVTEISISHPREVYVRHGFGELVRFEKTFDSNDHFAYLLQNVLGPLGIDLATSDPFLEVGLTLARRPIRLALTGPPMMPYYSGQIRLHPSLPLGWEDVSPIISTDAVELLIKIIARGHGLLIVGDGGVGKTTLLANLLQYVPLDQKVALIQRAGEIHPMMVPEDLHSVTSLPQSEPPTTVFEREIATVLENGARRVLVDEIQGDEGDSLWRLLTDPQVSQFVATFRGKANTARLMSALTMTIRKVHRTLPQEDINAALLERLPFVVILSHPVPKDPPRLVLLGQWIADGSDLSIEPLIEWGADARPQRTEATPRYNLS